PLEIEGFAGVTAIDTSAAGVTVSSVEPVMLPLVAEIVEVPAPTVVASPVLLMVATVAVPEAHTALASTCVELSLNVPVAVNCCVSPLATEGFAAVTAIDTRAVAGQVCAVRPVVRRRGVEMARSLADAWRRAPAVLVLVTGGV